MARSDSGPLTALAVCTVLAAGCNREPPPAAAVAERWDLLARYCTDCHNDAERAGELTFEHVVPADVAAHPATWEKVVRKLRVDLMPPPSIPRPDSAAVDAFVASLTAYLDQEAAARGPMPGSVPLHRMNRTEYAAAIRDLLGFEIDARAMLPGDISSEGFDNVAEVLGVSPTHLDQYIAAARDISIQAVGNPAPDPERRDYRSDIENRTAHVAGLPFGTRDGLIVEHDFPADGDYELSLNISSIPGSELRGYPYGWLEYRHDVAILIDGAIVFEGSIGGAADSLGLDQGQIQSVEAIRDRFRRIRVPVKAGRRSVAAAFTARSYAEGDYLLQSFVPGEGVPDVPRLYGVEVIGPFDSTGISGSTASRDRIFVCYPETLAEQRPCATEIFDQLARRAFRRSVEPAELEPILGFYDAGAQAGGFEVGIQKGLMAILASTKFLYRAEPARAVPVADNGTYPISDLELAWRLSFFIWSQGPDQPLLELAEQGRLADPAVLDAELRRLLADPRSQALVTNFAFQWLDVRRLDAIDPDPRLFPNFDEDLRRAFVEEMRLFLDSILRSDRSVLDLLNARHTFVNERLARHYGLGGVRDDRFRRVELDDPARWGLFGKGSVLMVTSYPDRTSPVLRGAWIMERLLATPPTPPPPGVETDLTPAVGDPPRTVRERLARHRTQTSCNQCHGVIDPLGQALENFNAIGEWRERERDNGIAIDATGSLAGGARVNGPADLREALGAEPELFVGAVTEKLMVYALGRALDYTDMPSVRAIVAAAAREGYSFPAIVRGVASSAAFRMRTASEAPGD